MSKLKARLPSKEPWFVTGSQHLCGPKTLNRKPDPVLGLLLLSAVLFAAADAGSAENELGEYRVDPVRYAEAKALFDAPRPEGLAFPNPHPDAQWFPTAGFGLFMHWGIHSVEGLDPSWSMVKNCRWHKPQDKYAEYQEDRGRYYALAARFNPQHYNPDKWLAAARKAGFQYAVLTTKHHDGYALWPSQYGKWNTRNWLEGRDLLRDYVDACRRHGLKVGFYFSPRDWAYPGYPEDFDQAIREEDQKPAAEDPEENLKRFEQFYAYTIAQLQELLTRYGQIDLLWFDGLAWPGVEDLRGAQTVAWIRSLQPGIVINDRWPGVRGDFDTVEGGNVGKLPEDLESGDWWEACKIWMPGSWGYNPDEQFRPLSWVFENLVHARRYGGSFLCNVGPRPDGTMPDNFYRHCGELADWMKHSKASLIGAGPTPGADQSNVSITTGKGMWFLHLLPGFQGEAQLKTEDEIKRATLLRGSKELPFERTEDAWTIEVPPGLRTDMDDVVAVEW